MDFQKILQARSNRATRLARPFANFFEIYQQCVAAGDLIISGAVDPKAHTLIERSAVISLVTSVEVYYRDILDFIFRYCEPQFFEPHLKHLCPEKFDIAELVEMYRHRLHPLELVSSAQSFQNAERIDRVFSRFISKGGLWDAVCQLRVRVKDDPGIEASLSSDELDGLKRTFTMRHELVHDPARRSFFNESTLADLHATASMVFGSDVVLSQVIQANRDPTLDNETGA